MSNKSAVLFTLPWRNYVLERAAKALLGIEGKRLTYRPADKAAHL
jgi:hypothetical protein